MQQIPVVIYRREGTLSFSDLWRDVSLFLKENYQFNSKKGKNAGIHPFVITSMSTETQPFEVIVTAASIDKLLSNGGPSKFSCLYHLKKIVENGVLDRVELPKPEHARHEKKVYWFQTKVEVEEIPYLFIFTVKEMKDKTSYKKVYSGHLDIKKPLTE